MHQRAGVDCRLMWHRFRILFAELLVHCAMRIMPDCSRRADLAGALIVYTRRYVDEMEHEAKLRPR